MKFRDCKTAKELAEAIKNHPTYKLMSISTAYHPKDFHKYKGRVAFPDHGITEPIDLTKLTQPHELYRIVKGCVLKLCDENPDYTPPADFLPEDKPRSGLDNILLWCGNCVAIPKGKTKQVVEYENIFRKEGEVWHIVYKGQEIFLKNTVGVRCINALLSPRMRNKPRLSMTLYRMVTTRYSKTGGAKELDLENAEPKEPKKKFSNRMTHTKADVEAIKQCRQELGRLKDLRENGEAGPETEDDIRMLEQYLLEVTKPGRGSVQFDNDLTRAAKNVGNAITRTYDEIKKTHKPLWLHFTNSITTGMSCIYNPEDNNIRWEL